MLILIDSPEHRAKLVESIRRRMDEEVEEIALTIYHGGKPKRALRRLRLLTKLLVSIEGRGRVTTH